MAKRPLVDSDCEDLFLKTEDSCMTPPGSESCGPTSRKKRRGVIEKRRRDRINNSLTELRRLVPTAFEKQGSAKLEKAEILQMTVDHLKMLHAKGLDALAYDPHKFAMDYHSIGFRECAAEVARYMVTVEGMDIQDPLRMRLMSHLQCFAAQRELANKQANASSWGLNPLTPNHTYSIPSHHHLSNSSSPGGLSTMGTPLQGASQHSSLVDVSPPNNNHVNVSYLNSSTQLSPNMGTDLITNSTSHHQVTHPAGTSNPMGSQPIVQGGHQRSLFPTLAPPPPPPTSSNTHHSHIAREYTQHGANPIPSNPFGTSSHSHHGHHHHHQSQLNNPSNYPVQSTGKPYRPWGTELAY